MIWGAQVKDKTSNPFAFMIGCLVHDVGKLKTTKNDPITGKITAINHDEVGAKIVPDVLKNLIKSKTVVQFATDLTKNHMLGHNILNMRPIKIKRLMLKLNIEDLLLFNICDNSKSNMLVEAKIMSDFEKKENLVRSFEQGAPFKIIPVIQGRDLIKIGFAPSSKFRELLAKALEWQLEGRSKESILKSLSKMK